MNLFANLATNLPAEEILPLLSSGPVRIERILSSGQSSPPGFWYDQEEHEWVLVLRGRGLVEYADGRTVALAPGDHLHIPPGVRHRVAQTSREEPTLWLAVFWREEES
jgi:cupin 2 domain-containing protein